MCSSDLIGCIAIGFVVFQFFKEKIFAVEGKFDPSHAIGVPMGVAAGVTSTFANGAGPVIAMFLIPQRLPKDVFVGTNALIFAFINSIKLVFFVPRSIVTVETLKWTAWFALAIPAGVALGIWMNQRLSERWFTRLIYLFTFLTGVQLIIGFDLSRVFGK